MALSLGQIIESEYKTPSERAKLVAGNKHQQDILRVRNFMHFHESGLHKFHQSNIAVALQNVRHLLGMKPPAKVMGTDFYTQMVYLSQYSGLAPALVMNQRRVFGQVNTHFMVNVIHHLTKEPNRGNIIEIGDIESAEESKGNSAPAKEEITPEQPQTNQAALAKLSKLNA